MTTSTPPGTTPSRLSTVASTTIGVEKQCETPNHHHLTRPVKNTNRSSPPFYRERETTESITGQKTLTIVIAVDLLSTVERERGRRGPQAIIFILFFGLM
jgi:hypothetical protein